MLPGRPKTRGLLISGERVLHGAVAHRDFATFYGPGMPWALAGSFLMFGPSGMTERGVGLFLQLAISLLILWLAVHWGPRQAAASGAIAALMLFPFGPFPSPWLAALALLLGSFALMARRDGATASRQRFAAAGLLSALALIFRIDLAPVVLLSTLPFLLRAGRTTGWYLAGVVLGLVPLAAHIIVASPSTVIRNVFVDAFCCTGGRRLPLPPMELIPRVAFFVTLGSTALAVIAAIALARSPRVQTHSRLFASITLLSIGLLPQMLQRADLFHVLEVACLSVAVFPISASIVAEHFHLHLPVLPRPAYYASCALFAAAVALAAARYAYLPPGVTVSNQGREFIVLPSEVQDANAVLADVDRVARPGQRLLVGPADMRRTNYTATYLYFLLPQLVPGTHYLELNPGVANASDSGLATDVAHADVLVLTTEWDTWNEPNSSSQYGSDLPNQIVASLFCQRAHDGVYRIYTRCEAT